MSNFQRGLIIVCKWVFDVRFWCIVDLGYINFEKDTSISNLTFCALSYRLLQWRPINIFPDLYLGEIVGFSHGVVEDCKLVELNWCFEQNISGLQLNKMKNVNWQVNLKTEGHVNSWHNNLISSSAMPFLVGTSSAFMESLRSKS